MSDKRTGKKNKPAAALTPPPTNGAAPVVSDLTQRPAMKKKASAWPALRAWRLPPKGNTLFARRIPAVAATVAAEPLQAHHQVAQWDATALPQQMETSRFYATERAFRTDADAMALAGWRMVGVRFGPGRRRFVDRWRRKRPWTRTAEAHYLRP